MSRYRYYRNPPPDAIECPLCGMKMHRYGLGSHKGKGPCTVRMWRRRMDAIGFTRNAGRSDILGKAGIAECRIPTAQSSYGRLIYQMWAPGWAWVFLVASRGKTHDKRVAILKSYREDPSRIVLDLTQLSMGTDKAAIFARRVLGEKSKWFPRLGCMFTEPIGKKKEESA